MYDYSTTTVTTTDPGAAAAVVAFMTAYFLVILVVGIIMIVALWKIFTKAGRPGWGALIPLYNTYLMIETAGKPGWWLLLLFIPFVNIVVIIMVMLALAQAFGKSTVFAIFGLMIFSPIGMLMLAFGDAKYQLPKPKTA